MSDAPFQDENPYASPTSTLPVGVEPDGRICSAKAPVDALDILIGMTNVALALAVLIGLPFGIGIGLQIVGSPFSSLLFLIPALLWSIWAGSRTVVSVSIDEIGLHFQRHLRSTDDWHWETLTAIRPATRWEVTWYGWIGPLLRPRERTSCMSTIGHYRIQGKTDYCFFPPKNPEAFVEAIARYRPDLLTQ
jgi:hypothetical protein